MKRSESAERCVGCGPEQQAEHPEHRHADGRRGRERSEHDATCPLVHGDGEDHQGTERSQRGEDWRHSRQERPEQEQQPDEQRQRKQEQGGYGPSLPDSHLTRIDRTGGKRERRTKTFVR